VDHYEIILGPSPSGGAMISWVGSEAQFASKNALQENGLDRNVKDKDCSEWYV